MLSDASKIRRRIEPGPNPRHRQHHLRGANRRSQIDLRGSGHRARECPRLSQRSVIAVRNVELGSQVEQFTTASGIDVLI
jgi:hypothetical protein